MDDAPRLYRELAGWWPLLSAPEDYAGEAAFFRGLLAPDGPAAGGRPTLLELGSGGGNLASHLKAHFSMTLSDLSPHMLAVSRRLNPDLEHVEGDFRTLRLGRAFDAVLLHDAVMYCTDAGQLAAALATAAAHCRPDGRVVVAPDCVRETFRPGTGTGGHDASDGRGLRYLEWSLPPRAGECVFEVLYAVVLREADGTARVELDRHREGLFAESEWLAHLREAGLTPTALTDPWSRRVFVAERASTRLRRGRGWP